MKAPDHDWNPLNPIPQTVPLAQRKRELSELLQASLLEHALPQHLLDCWELVKVSKFKAALLCLSKASEIIEREAELAKGDEA